MSLRRLTALATAAAVCALTAGCGGGGGSSRPSGKVVFAQECSACHSLTGHNDPRRQGGDLLRFHSSRTQLVQLAAEMPVRHALSQPQLQAVVDYVMDVESGR